MKQIARNTACLVFLSLVLAGCAVIAPSPTPAPTPRPSPTPLPTPTPTATPLPPIELTIQWSEDASALAPTTVRVELPGLVERDPAARVRAVVSSPDSGLWWQSDLTPEGGGVYAAVQPLYLPLAPAPGDWRLIVVVAATAPVVGQTMLHFTPRAIPLHSLNDLAPEGVQLAVPQIFSTVWNEGDLVAGRRAWAGSGGEVTLWWTPGPAEALTQDTAEVLVDATYLEVPVEIESVEPVEWYGLTAFRFREWWAEGPGDALVVQGPDYWLYVVRVRALEGEGISPLLVEIQETFRAE